LTLAATAIEAEFSWLISETAWAELVAAGELELPVDDGADDEDDEPELELEHALAPTAKAKARLEPATAVPIRRARMTFLMVCIVEPLPVWCFRYLVGRSCG
jgi:hypothetical protein